MMWAAAAALAYGYIAARLYRGSMRQNPHYLRDDHRLEWYLLAVFTIIWPITLPPAVFLWRRSPEKRLLDLRKRRGGRPPDPNMSRKKPKQFTPRKK